MTIIEEKLNWAWAMSARTSTTHLIIHHAAGTGTVQQIHSIHLGNGWAGIAYHYYIRKDGSIYRGRPENVRGGHTENMNSVSVGICFEGNFQAETMGAAQIQAGQELVADIVSRYPGIKVTRHSDHNATACPGANFPFDVITSGKPVEITPDANGCPYGTTTATVREGSTGIGVYRCQWYLDALHYSVGAIDGIYGALTAGAVKRFQGAYGLDMDGICGPDTWAALEQALAELNKEDEDMTDEKVRELIREANPVYESAEDVPEWGRATVDKLVAKGLLKGDDQGLNVSYDLLRVLVVNDRAGLYGEG